MLRDTEGRLVVLAVVRVPARGRIEGLVAGLVVVARDDLVLEVEGSEGERRQRIDRHAARGGEGAVAARIVVVRLRPDVGGSSELAPTLEPVHVVVRVALLELEGRRGHLRR